jgi:hypothetical protein
MLQQQQTAADRHAAPPSTQAAGRGVAEAGGRRALEECPECGHTSPGEVLCPACAGWPLCEGGCGTRLPGGGTCERCVFAAHHAQLAVEADDGRCPGHDGIPCGKPVQTIGMCGTCRIAAETARRARDADLRTALAAAVDAATAEESNQSEQAPF